MVGGFVRDHLLGVRTKDVDIEVFGLGVEKFEALLANFGKVHAVGRAFGVFRVAGIDVDFSLPRRDSKRGPGHRGFDVAPDPSLDFAEAARRRDLTVNSIGLDPLTGEVLDPHGGRRDLKRRILRATDSTHFSEDPLRGLRVAQLAARLEMPPDEELIALCWTLDIDELSGEPGVRRIQGSCCSARRSLPSGLRYSRTPACSASSPSSIPCGGSRRTRNGTRKATSGCTP